MDSPPRSLKRKISPPPVRKSSSRNDAAPTFGRRLCPEPTPAAVEAGQAEVRDHVEYFCDELAKVRRESEEVPLSLEQFRAVYEENQHSSGHHFVIHQHDHPVSGVHYDLRLQFSESSSLSFSIPYGVPGNPNSLRPNRMAIETRVHNVWNNLIESASNATGSLLIWGTGEYEVIPRPSKRKPLETDDELSSASADEKAKADGTVSEQPQRLIQAFHDRHVHLRLHGTRLPRGYTIAMRLPMQNYRDKQPRAPKRRRRRKDHPVKPTDRETTDSKVSESGSTSTTNEESTVLNEAAAASDDEARDAAEQDSIRQNNAYPGATNSIGSIHQRQWFLSLDRENSGFEKARHGPDKGRWVRRGDGDGNLYGFENFYVMGREVESSVVTGRKAEDVMADAGIEAYAGRKMWRPIMR